MSRYEVSIVVPAFNEGSTLAGVLERLDVELASLRSRYQTELLVVDDGSTDETGEIIEKFARARSQVRAVTHPANRGLTEAMKTGARAAAGRIVVFLDADLSYAPVVAERLVDALEHHAAGAAVASPYMRGGRVANVPFDRLIASRVANFLLAACVGFRLHTFTGMVRAYDRAALLKLLERPVRGEFNAWVVAEFLRARKLIVEIPAALVWPNERTQGPSRMSAATWRARMRLVLETLRELRSVRRTRGAPATNGT